MKKYISLLLAIVLSISILPLVVFAEEFISLKELAESNGYEYFEYPEKDTVNVRSASYILSFQNGNNMAGYKTVLGDVGTITLNHYIKKKDNVFYVSKLDAQTKLIKYFPNTPDSFISDFNDDEQIKNNSLPSDWAADEIEEATENGLVTSNSSKNYKANITREYFCELVIKLYEKISGNVVTSDYNPFKDTDNNDVIKAYKLGIVNGVSDTEFAPYEYITRQEICAMLVRTIGVMYPNIDPNDYDYHTFSDSAYISGWAMDSVQFAYDNNIIQGVGDNKLEPLGNTTCEQAILLINRIYQNKDIFEKRDNDSQKVIEPLKTLNFDDNNEVKSVTVSFEDGSDASGVKIREINSSDLIYQTTGMKGAGVNITSSDNFDKATITFEYNSEQLNGSNPSDLAIAWYNTDLDRIEILESQVDTYNHTVSVETTHFSQYILVDSKEWYSIWQRGQTIIREMDNDGNYAENFNVQLVVDCSGSMSGDRIITARECTYDFIEKLSDNDKFSIIQFEDSAKTTIPSTLVKDADMDSVKNTVMSMRDGGGTNFDSALNECINTLNFDDNYNNIIVFLSDGGSNVSDSLLQTLKENDVRIASVALGSGSDTNRMKQLSDSTNGQYVYAEDSSDLDAIYDAIQGSLIGVDATDSDGDGIPDMIEITGMKNQYGKIIRTDPNKYDTDGDGKSDGEEMGELIETDELTDMDKKNGITSNVYFKMVSNPLDGINEDDIPNKVDKDSNGYLLTVTGTIVLEEDTEGAIIAHLRKDGEIQFKDLSFKSNNESIVEVLETTEDGMGGTLAYLKAIKSGETTITVTYGNSKAICNVIVNDYIKQHIDFVNSATYMDRMNVRWGNVIAQGLNTKLSNTGETMHDILTATKEIITGESLSVFDNPYDLIIADLVMQEISNNTENLKLKYDYAVNDYISKLEELCKMANPDWKTDLEYSTFFEKLKKVIENPTDMEKENPRFYSLCKKTFNKINDSQLDKILNVYGKANVLLEGYNDYSKVVEWVSECLQFNSVVDAFRDTSDEYKHILVLVSALMSYKSGLDISLQYQASQFNTAITKYFDFLEKNDVDLLYEYIKNYTGSGLEKIAEVFVPAFRKTTLTWYTKGLGIKNPKVVGWIEGVIFGVDTGMTIADALTNNDETMNCRKLLRASSYMEKYVSDCLDTMEKELRENRDTQSAKYFDAIYRIMQQTEIYSLKTYKQYLEKQQSSVTNGLLHGFNWSYNGSEIEIIDAEIEKWQNAVCHK